MYSSQNFNMGYFQFFQNKFTSDITFCYNTVLWKQETVSWLIDSYWVIMTNSQEYMEFKSSLKNKFN